MKWISVNDSLPPARVKVLVAYANGVTIAERDGYLVDAKTTHTYWRGHKGPKHQLMSVTHWMPLPVHPKVADFYTWCVQQYQYDESPKGDFVIDMMYDEERTGFWKEKGRITKEEQLPKVKQHLGTINDSAYLAFCELWKEWSERSF